MTLLEKLNDKTTWLEFQQYKNEKAQLSEKEQKQLETFIVEERYKPLAQSLDLGIPKKMMITKSGSSKKRVVYCFGKDETWMLKLLGWLLYKYDKKISANCYSFRRRMSAKDAVEKILRIKDLNNKYVLKVDIHNYFNSIPVEGIVDILKQIIEDDEPLLDFLIRIFTDGRCLYNDEIIKEERGAMAGIPLASFIANIYLLSLDNLFDQMRIPYFRYSDDILVFTDNKQQCQECLRIITQHIEEKGLTLNEDKLVITEPGQPWDFLGFRYVNGKVDLALATIEKTKGKIRRKAHSLYRYRLKKNASFQDAAFKMIKTFDCKFYDMTGENEFTWSRWFFPVITSTDGLHQIDEYMVMYLRYLATGRHYKGNYRIDYQQLKNLGYTSLVNEYYTWKKECEELEKLA